MKTRISSDTTLSNSQLIHRRCCSPPRSPTLRSSPSLHQRSPPDDYKCTDSYAPVHVHETSCGVKHLFTHQLSLRLHLPVDFFRVAKLLSSALVAFFS